jgi:alpha-amylase
MTSASMATRFVVSEYFDGNPANLYYWVHGSGMEGRSSVFDFTLHFALQAMCDDPGFDMIRMAGVGYASIDPFNAVTFVDNPDTDVSPGEAIVANKLLAYAFILTTEGYPFVFHKDYSTEPGCYGLKPWIDNLVWIHEHLANGPTATRWNDKKTIVLERLGAPGLLVGISTDVWNARQITCQTAFGPGVLLHDYTGRHPDILTDAGGRASFTLPSNAYGGGRSYLCFSRAGVGGPNIVEERTTTQTFFGGSDLDVPPAFPAQAIPSGRIWCAAGKPIEAQLGLPGIAPGGSVALRIVDPTGSVLTSHVFRDAAGAGAHAIARSSGWHTLELTASGVDGPVPYALSVNYTAPTTLVLSP